MRRSPESPPSREIAVIGFCRLINITMYFVPRPMPFSPCPITRDDGDGGDSGDPDHPIARSPDLAPVLSFGFSINSFLTNKLFPVAIHQGYNRTPYPGLAGERKSIC